MGEATNQEMVDVSGMDAEDGVRELVHRAVALKASDLYLTANEQHLAVIARHLGVLRTISIMSVDQGRRLQAHIKAISGMDLGERRRPLDGRWIYERDEEQFVDLRINVIPTLHGEDFAIRMLDHSTGLYSMDDLGMTASQLSQYEGMINSPSGLILITGPTGAGKTMTLYSTLTRLNSGNRKINTIEDPVEFELEGLRQSQINPAINLGFAEMLRGVLRQSPDVVMVGEIRDPETAQTAVHAGNSGILVFATLHAPSATGAVESLRAMGVHSHFLAASLRGVVTQRLIRTLCPKCKVPFDLSESPYTFDEIKDLLGRNEGKTLYGHKGCEACHMMGYIDRTGVFEIMPINRRVQDLIASEVPIAEIRRKAIEEGMLEFRRSALLKVAQGQTSTEEVFRVIPAEHLLTHD